MSKVELTVRGSIEHDAIAAVAELRVARCGHGATTLAADVVDQAQLYGIIDAFRDYGVELLALRCHVDEAGRR
jgi:hypothetical protein